MPLWWDIIGMTMLERNIFNEPTDHDFERDSSEFNNESMIRQDDYHLKNLVRMVTKATKPHVARMWEVKVAELMNNMRWRSLSNRAHGYEYRGANT